ncbi:uncharacterized protein BDV14DRAFT_174078 [Aspergillus stella-maris]|uniref:uncharacterized protein n=1 Tax=Aspergillus stella-maris TaxID=1810926 RepID=UPI003CCDBF4A
MHLPSRIITPESFPDSPHPPPMDPPPPIVSSSLPSASWLHRRSSYLFPIFHRANAVALSIMTVTAALIPLALDILTLRCTPGYAALLLLTPRSA